jgi:Transglutaminase-like superfamily
MGAIVFILITAAGLYMANYFRRSLLDLPNSGSKRIQIHISNIRSNNLEPIVTKSTIDAPIEDRSILSVSDRILSNYPPNPIADSTLEVSPNFTLAPSTIEESLLFRVLVYGMMVFSTIAIDLVARTHYGIVAMPLMTIGSLWSWYRRDRLKHWLNWFVSLSILAISSGLLVPILVRDMQSQIDRAAPDLKTPIAVELALGMMSVWLLMSLSWHLYNRRIFGYCMTISLVQIAIVASCAHNFSFLILLSGFMAIAIPALMLDYRSRINLTPIGMRDLPTAAELSYRNIPWQYSIELAGISIGIGLIISLFLPNFRIPELSFQPEGSDKLSALAPKDRSPKLDLKSLSPAPNSSPLSPIDPAKIAPKLLGQPDNNNYPDSIKQDYLKLSPEISAQLQDFSHKILATAPQPLNSDYERAAYLGEYLKHHSQANSQAANLAPIDAKLIQQLISSCTADPKTCQLAGNKQDLPIVYTSMLRSIGIPSRLKTGTNEAKFDPQTQMYLRPSASLESQTEVYFPNWGWLDLDSTPDRSLLNLDDRQIAQMQQQLEQQSTLESPAPILSPSPSNRSEIPNLATPTPSVDPKWEPDLKIVKIILIAIAICSVIAWYLWHQRRTKQQLSTLAPVERIYRSMVTNLSKGGVIKHATQTQLEYAESTNNIYHPQIVKAAKEISQLYTAWRYGKQTIDINQLSKKLQYLEHLQQLAAQKKRHQQIVKLKAKFR